VPPYPDLLQRKLFSPFQSPKKKTNKQTNKQKRRINPNFVSSSPLQSSCCITSKTAQANLEKHLQKIPRNRKTKQGKKKEHEK
jgi:hypothetical protein